MSNTPLRRATAAPESPASPDASGFGEPGSAAPGPAAQRSTAAGAATSGSAAQGSAAAGSAAAGSAAAGSTAAGSTAAGSAAALEEDAPGSAAREEGAPRTAALRSGAPEDGERSGSGSGSGKGGRKRWTWATVGVLAVVAVGAGAYAINASGGSDGDESGKATVAASAVVAGNGIGGGDEAPYVVDPGAQDAVLNRTGADGAFIVTVAGVKCGIAAVGPADLLQRANGRFCLVSVSVENAGREPRLLDGSAQRAVDAHGKNYAVDDRAAAFLNAQTPTLLDEVAAGATVRGVLPFDVPAGTRLNALLVHESGTSKGAKIALS
jgi:hypothetical protein